MQTWRLTRIVPMAAFLLSAAACGGDAAEDSSGGMTGEAPASGSPVGTDPPDIGGGGLVDTAATPPGGVPGAIGADTARGGTGNR